MELRESVALLVEGYQWDSGEAETEARQIADAILSLPEIKEALRERETNLGAATKLGRL